MINVQNELRYAIAWSVLKKLLHDGVISGFKKVLTFCGIIPIMGFMHKLHSGTYKLLYPIGSNPVGLVTSYSKLFYR
jgi:hypothetical protein